MEDYKYKNVPLTPLIIEELIINLFNGKTVRREEIVNSVLEYHLMNKGQPPVVQDLPRSVKKSLENISNKGIGENVSYGYWRIHDENITSIEETNDVNDENVIELEEEEEFQEYTDYNVFGEGNSAVYLYYFEGYKELALLKGEKTWPCKIGMSERNPKIRILSQSATALPEIPKIEFIIKTDKPTLLEATIHSILKIRGKQIEHSPGKEWFNTTPEEILEIIKFINEEF